MLLTKLLAPCEKLLIKWCRTWQCNQYKTVPILHIVTLIIMYSVFYFLQFYNKRFSNDQITLEITYSAVLPGHKISWVIEW